MRKRRSDIERNGRRNKGVEGGMYIRRTGERGEEVGETKKGGERGKRRRKRSKEEEKAIRVLTGREEGSGVVRGEEEEEEEESYKILTCLYTSFAFILSLTVAVILVDYRDYQ